MRNSRFAVALIALALPLAFAAVKVSGQQSNNGSVTEGTYGSVGNPSTGGYNATGGTVTYATPPTSDQQVSGYADVAGIGTSTLLPNGTASNANFHFNVGVTGPQSTMDVNGFAGEATWATAPSSSAGNFADGGGSTSGTIDGSYSGDASCNPVTGDGSVNADGKTIAGTQLSSDGLSSSSFAKTNGVSSAQGNLNGSPIATGAQGQAGIEAGSFVAGPNGAGAEANGAGNMQYGAATPSGASAGSLAGVVKTTSSVSASGNSAQSSASVKTGAQSSTQ